ncbi:MAG: hypothetical protein M4579_002467 [Chaenotheca gracillima]|nr:MAG: hypothetical protein M4579_002467 [Chaenotheca gracillima]
MSRRAPNPAADRAAQNQATIKNLLKLEGNKTCADCKRNKHPRWASWNLGIFVCIRCSGIHRGMGTHISRVKSVDLDAWTDDQLQSVLRWGNTKANKYWEAKLAPGHVPSEAKIENFIKTKYDSKRWVMDGGMPDPATLNDEADDDVPLGVVQTKQKLERASSNRISSTASQPAPPGRPSQNIDLFGDDTFPAPRPSTTEPAVTRQPPPKTATAPPKQTKGGDSLLGLDFFGPSSTPTNRPDRPASTQSQGTSGPSRPDLKQSILSLYASAPKQQPPSQSSQSGRSGHSQQGSFSGLQSPPAPQSQSQNAFGGMNDAFSGLSFSSPTSPPVTQSSKPSAFSGGLGSFSSQKSTPAPAQVSSPPLGGGDFFSAAPKPARTNPPPPKQPQINHSFSSSLDDFGAFDSGPSVSSPKTGAAKPSNSSDLHDLFDSSPPPPPKPKVSSPPVTQSSVFNLSTPAPPVPSNKPNQTNKPSSNTASGVSSGWSNADAWGDVWGAPEPTSTASKPPPPVSASGFKSPPMTSPPPATTSNTNAFSNDFSGGWGSTNDNDNNANSSGFGDFSSNAPGSGSSNNFGGMAGGFGASPSPPKIAADEDFGGWSSAAEPAPASRPAAPAASSKAPANPASSNQAKSQGNGFGGNDDLFSNVWE